MLKQNHKIRASWFPWCKKHRQNPVINLEFTVWHILDKSKRWLFKHEICMFSVWTSATVSSTAITMHAWRNCCLTTWGHKVNLQSCSESHFTSISPFHTIKTIFISYRPTHRPTQRSSQQPVKINIWLNLKKLWQYIPLNTVEQSSSNNNNKSIKTLRNYKIVFHV